MTAHDSARPSSAPHVPAYPWWVTLLIGAVVLVPSTAVLLLPATLSYGFQPGLMIVGWVVMATGMLGLVAAGFNALLCKRNGWWPIPAALVLQWIVACALYPMMW